MSDIEKDLNHMMDVLGERFPDLKNFNFTQDINEPEDDDLQDALIKSISKTFSGLGVDTISFEGEYGINTKEGKIINFPKNGDET
jgi:hypothetical protein